MGLGDLSFGVSRFMVRANECPRLRENLVTPTPSARSYKLESQTGEVNGVAGESLTTQMMPPPRMPVP
jgi:hypothetical protein